MQISCLLKNTLNSFHRKSSCKNIRNKFDIRKFVPWQAINVVYFILKNLNCTLDIMCNIDCSLTRHFTKFYYLITITK